MINPETPILHAIWLALSTLTGRTVRLFRNNVGLAKLPNGGRLRYGLCTGSSDLIGWTRCVITPDMVGRTVAVFTAIEVKTPDGEATPQQVHFIDEVKKAGGYAGTAVNIEEASRIINNEPVT